MNTTTKIIIGVLGVGALGGIGYLIYKKVKVSKGTNNGSNSRDNTNQDDSSTVTQSSESKIQFGTTTNKLFKVGQSWTSPNKAIKVEFQSDGNLVVNYKGKPFWSSQTQNMSGQTLALQTDGNMFIYTKDMIPLWSSMTQGKGNYLEIQNDGNMVVYNKDKNALFQSGVYTPPEKECECKNCMPKTVLGICPIIF